jgi:GNAT superfamily N-acetyltransferase
VDRALRELLPEVAAAFRPDVIVLQNGCDGHVLDPLTHLRATTRMYEETVRITARWRTRYCGGRIVATGGGGYAIWQVVPRAWTLVWAGLSGQQPATRCRRVARALAGREPGTAARLDARPRRRFTPVPRRAEIDRAQRADRPVAAAQRRCRCCAAGGWPSEVPTRRRPRRRPRRTSAWTTRAQRTACAVTPPRTTATGCAPSTTASSRSARRRACRPLGRERIDLWLGSILPLGTHLVVEDVDGDVVGHAFLIATGRAGEAEYAIFLRQDIRGRGIGTCVNRVAVAVARSAGWARLWLSAEPHNRPAIRSYQKVGFRFVASEFLAAEVEMELELAPPAGAS